MTIPSFPTLVGQTFVHRAPLWSTLKQPAVSGRETRLSQWSTPRWKYTLGFDFARSDATAEFQTLLGFINALSGAAGVFAFTDPADNTATDQEFGQGDGATTGFQLVRTFGGFAEPVLCPIGTPTVTVDGQATTAFALGDGGAVTFNAAPAAGATLAWTGSFAWLCRLDADTADFQQFAANFWKLGKLGFTTIKL